jgi:hypothetical protein
MTGPRRLLVPRPLDATALPLLPKFCRDIGLRARIHLAISRTIQAGGEAFAAPEFPASMAGVFAQIGLETSSAAYKAFNPKGKTIPREYAAEVHARLLGDPLLAGRTHIEMELVGSKDWWVLKLGLALPQGLLPVDVSRCDSVYDRVWLFLEGLDALRGAGHDVPVVTFDEPSIDVLVWASPHRNFTWTAQVTKYWKLPRGAQWTNPCGDFINVGDAFSTLAGEFRTGTFEIGTVQIHVLGPSPTGHYLLQRVPKGAVSRQALDRVIPMFARPKQTLAEFPAERLHVVSRDENRTQYYVFWRALLWACFFQRWRESDRPRLADDQPESGTDQGR